MRRSVGGDCLPSPTTRLADPNLEGGLAWFRTRASLSVEPLRLPHPGQGRREGRGGGRPEAPWKITQMEGCYSTSPGCPQLGAPGLYLFATRVAATLRTRSFEEGGVADRKDGLVRDVTIRTKLVYHQQSDGYRDWRRRVDGSLPACNRRGLCRVCLVGPRLSCE